MSSELVLKQFKNVVNAALPLGQDSGVLDEKIIDDIIETFANLPMYAGISSDEINRVRNEIHTNYKIRLTKGTALVSKQHKKWFVTKKPLLEPLKYWDRFEQYMQNDLGFSRSVVSSLDEVSDEIVDLLGDPTRDKEEQRRGLIIGDVQSGKTVNYSGIICKAVDAGYRTVILMTGTGNDLRRQTQIRLDEAFIGMDSASVGKKDRLVFTGVGKYDPSLSPQAVTTTERDFSKVVSRSYVTRLNPAADGHPMLFVIKKNVSVLKNLNEWIKALNQIDERKIANSILMIDDEADYASINTKSPENDPTTTNKLIVELLNNFEFASYIGFTATPYANIFIDPRSNEEMQNENLFPGDYIYALEAPSDYIGARDIFGENGRYSYALRDINDGEDFYPFKHKNGDFFGHLSATLKKAINTFLVANVIRDLRGDQSKHRSMIVNVSRFTANQNQVRDAIDAYLSDIRTSVNNYASLPSEKALQDKNIQALFDVFQTEYRNTYSWDEIMTNLRTSISPILVFSANQSSNKLKYDEYEDGLRVIAVGGQALSRGLTLEGLMVSYLYRNSKAYDTLMQMGRWFGYRRNYDDICRIWMDEESQGWYRTISNATDELRSDIKRMKDRNATPLEFGLKVRNDPEVPLIITARNKMRGALPQFINSTLSSKVVDTPFLHNDPDINRNNLVLVKNILESQSPYKDEKGKYAIKDVTSNTIIHLLENMSIPGSNIKFDPKAIAKFISGYEGPELSNWDIALVSGDGRNFEITDKVAIDGSKRVYDLHPKNEKKNIRLNKSSTRIASPTDAAFGLTKEQVEDVKLDFFKTAAEGAKTIPSDNYFGEVVKGRKPLLMIYFVDLGEKVEGVSDFSGNPLIGFAIGIPHLTDQKTKYIRYQTNTIYQDLGSPGDESDED